MCKFPFLCRFCLIPSDNNHSVKIFDDTNEIAEKVLELTNVKGVFCRPQDASTSTSAGADLSVNVQGSIPGTSSLTNAINQGSQMAQTAMGMPFELVNGMSQFLSGLFGGSGSGSVQMSLSQSDLTNLINNMIQQGISASGDASNMANQMFSGLLSSFSQPEVLNMLTQLVNSGIVKQGDNATSIVINTNQIPMPTEMVNQLSKIGTSINGNLTIDLANPQSLMSLVPFLQSALTLMNSGLNLGIDVAKIPMDIASQGMNMATNMLTGQGGGTVTIGTTQPDTSLGSLGSSVQKLATNGAQFGLDMMQLPLSSVNNGISMARQAIGDVSTPSVSSTLAVSPLVVPDSSSQSGSLTLSTTGSGSGLGRLINSGADLATAGVNLAGSGITTARQLMSALLGGGLGGSYSTGFRLPTLVIG